MKKLSFVLPLLLLLQSVKAQTWSEWFRQKKTQIKYLTEQIAALKAYGDIAWKGYGIAKNGLTDIGVIKDGDRTMHGDYFASLRTLNPTVRHYNKVAQIVVLQTHISRCSEVLKKRIQSSDLLTPDEATYVANVLAALLAGCTDVVNNLITLTSNQTSALKDDERIARIDALYADIQDKDAFLQHFSADTRALLLQRQRDAHDSKTLKAFFGIQ